MEALTDRDRDLVLLILREARSALDSKEWIREALMRDRAGRAVAPAPFTPSKLAAFRDQDNVQLADPVPVECDDVAGCCAVGFVSFATFCLVELLDPGIARTNALADAAGHALEEVLWARPDVREAADQWWEANDYRTSQTVEEHVEAYGFSEVGEEGLVPFWNDRVAKDADEVKAVFDAAIATLMPA